MPIRYTLCLVLLVLGLPLSASPNLETVTGRTVKVGQNAPVIVTVVQQSEADAARKVGQAITDEEFATGKVIPVTVINFQNKLAPSMRKISKAQIELDLKKAAARLAPTYRRIGVDHSPMENLHAVADFDGSVGKSLGVDSEANPVVVLVYDGEGRLRARFPGAPGRKQMRELLDQLTR